MTPGPRDLVVLTADKNIEGALRGLLSRPRSLGLREISCDLYVHPERDPGCLGCDGFAAPLESQPFCANHPLKLVSPDLESEVEGRLSSSGWDDRAAGVVIDPELEIFGRASA